MSDRMLRDMWLAELWRPCPELSRAERARLAAEAEVRDEGIRARDMSTAQPDS